MPQSAGDGVCVGFAREHDLIKEGLCKFGQVNSGQTCPTTQQGVHFHFRDYNNIMASVSYVNKWKFHYERN